MTEVFTDSAMATIEEAARGVIAASSEGDALRTNLAILKRFSKRAPLNTIAIRRRIAERLLEAERYVLV
jgi:hypothetical protein